MMSLSCLSSGRANSSPEINCELTSPGTRKTPPFSLPSTVSGSPPSVFTAMPFSGRMSVYIPIGRIGSLPAPVNSALTPPAAATGIKNRSVLPLSLQRSVAVLLSKVPVPSTVSTPFSILVFAPSASTQPTVALISSESATGEMVQMPFDSAAQMIARWTSLFEGGARIVPCGSNG